jgi:hypothetical protein
VKVNNTKTELSAKKESKDSKPHNSTTSLQTVQNSTKTAKTLEKVGEKEQAIELSVNAADMAGEAATETVNEEQGEISTENKIEQ